MTLIGKAIIIGYIRKFIKIPGSYLRKRNMELADAPVLAGGNAHIFFKDPLKGSFIEF